MSATLTIVLLMTVPMILGAVIYLLFKRGGFQNIDTEGIRQGVGTLLSRLRGLRALFHRKSRVEKLAQETERAQQRAERLRDVLKAKQELAEKQAEVAKLKKEITDVGKPVKEVTTGPARLTRRQ